MLWTRPPAGLPALSHPQSTSCRRTLFTQRWVSMVVGLILVSYNKDESEALIALDLLLQRWLDEGLLLSCYAQGIIALVFSQVLSK